MDDAKTCSCLPCRQARSKGEQHALTLVRNQELRDRGFHVELPDGEHAIMRDPRAITEGQRGNLKEVIASSQVWADRIDKAISEGNLAVVDTLVGRQSAVMATADRQVVGLFVESWSYESIPPPQPHDVGSVRLIPGQAFNRLLAVAQDLWKEAWVDDTPTSMETDSPFAASNSSVPTS